MLKSLNILSIKMNKDDLKNIEARHMATGNYDENDLSSIENLKNDIHFVEEEK